MKVFVTGATGFVGQEILSKLHAAGHSIRILARNPDSAAAQKIHSQFSAEIHRGNTLDRQSLQHSCDDIDAVIHLVGIISEIGANTFENVHTRGTENVVRASQTAGVKHFVQMSALGARPNAVSRYHKSKFAAEEIVRASGLDFTIFRPSIIYGPRDHFVNLFARMSRWSPILPIMGSGQGTLQPISVDDVARCFAGALTEPRAIGQTCDLCGPDILTMPQVLKTICDVTGRKRGLLRIPQSEARCLARFSEFVFPRILRKPSPLNRDQLIMLEEKITGNGAVAASLFKIKPKHFRDGIEEYL